MTLTPRGVKGISEPLIVGNLGPRKRFIVCPNLAILVAMYARRSSKILVAIAITAFQMVGVFGIFYGMDMNSKGQMANCPFMGVTAICNMTPFEHIAAWQSMFTSIPQQSTGLTLLFALLSFALARLFIVHLARDADETTQRVSYFDREPTVFDPLRLAFARGIIHPKIF